MRSADVLAALLGARGRPGRDERSFLPAALEIVESPPSPIGQAIGATVIALFCLALAWASFGRIDIVASASGKIVPTGRTKVLQPFETGVIKAIHVRDGQAVKAGEPLIELDPTMNEADRNHARTELLAAQLDVARLRAALSDTKDAGTEFHPPLDADPEHIKSQRLFLINQINEHAAKLAALQSQRVQKEAERGTVEAAIAKLDSTIPVIQQRVDIRKVLLDQGLTSKITYLETLQLLLDQQQERAVQESRYREADAAVTAITKSRVQADAEYHRTLFGQLADAERKVAGLTEDLAKAEGRTKLQVLSAPVDGVVQQLAVHTIGGVVTPAQALLSIVPADSRLEIEAMVPNRDIGFVHPGQEAEIKVDTFNFTRYGLMHGTILSVSQDAITRENPADKLSNKAQGAENNSSEPKGQELIYSARISLDHQQMQVDGKPLDLAPGMAVTVEIKTGSRTIISYLLSPVLRYKQESLRER
jgi:hemolysin D